MNITHLRNFVEQDKKIKRLGNSIPYKSNKNHQKYYDNMEKSYNSQPNTNTNK
jgi:hypothetical protein